MRLQARTSWLATVRLMQDVTTVSFDESRKELNITRREWGGVRTGASRLHLSSIFTIHLENDWAGQTLIIRTCHSRVYRIPHLAGKPSKHLFHALVRAGAT